MKKKKSSVGSGLSCAFQDAFNLNKNNKICGDMNGLNNLMAFEPELRILDTNVIIEKTNPWNDSESFEHSRIDIMGLIIQLNNIVELLLIKNSIKNIDEEARVPISAISWCLGNWLDMVVDHYPRICEMLEQGDVSELLPEFVRNFNMNRLHRAFYKNKCSPEYIYDEQIAIILHFVSFITYVKIEENAIPSDISDKTNTLNKFYCDVPHLTYDSIVNFPYWEGFKPAIDELVNANFDLMMKT